MREKANEEEEVEEEEEEGEEEKEEGEEEEEEEEETKHEKETKQESASERIPVSLFSLSLFSRARPHTSRQSLVLSELFT